MITPYDWQEGIGNRAQYVEGKLRHGSPVLAVSLASGILCYTRKRQTKKIFEVYDRLIFSAIGQQSDIEAIRVAAVEFAHQEGYNRSEQDVTIQRVVSAMSSPVKKAFGDFSTSPIVARSLFAEVGADTTADQFYVLDYDGDYVMSTGWCCVAGTREAETKPAEPIGSLVGSEDIQEVAATLGTQWEILLRAADEELDASDLEPEIVLLERSEARENRFRVIDLKTSL